jgi:VWFA-related protein
VRRTIRTVVTCLLIVSTVGALRAQQPTFSSRADVVTVDVVVFDRQGNPVEGLQQSDFTVREDGKSQNIVAFDRVTLRGSAAAPPAAQRIATNATRPDAAGRWFFLVFDDVNVQPRSTQRAREVIAQLINTVLQPGDNVMIAVSSGGSTWAGQLPQDREDLLAFVNRLQGEHRVETGPERIWDHEAMGITLGRDKQAEAQVARRYFESGQLLEGAITPTPGTQLPEGGSLSDSLGVSPGLAMIRAKASQTYTVARSRLQQSLGRLERMSAALAEARGRKTLLVFSEGFIHDSTLPNFRTVVQAARNANVAVHFVDVGGTMGTLGGAGLPGGGAEQGVAVNEQDVTTSMALATREGDGARSVAKETGGSTISGSNLLAGLTRVVRESRAYYLLGYSSNNSKRDGKFRQIQVTVNRPGVTVRARGGYYAASDREPRPTPEDKLNPDVRAALDSPFGAPDLPMRLASYALAPQPDGKVQTLLVAEADIAPLKLQQFLGNYSAKLDSYVLVHDRDRDSLQRDEKLVEISLPPEVYQEAVKTGLPVVREFQLAPGHYQATVVLRDQKTGLLGSVRQDFEIPDPATFHLSTPIVTDIVQQASGTTVSRPIPVAHRAFPAGSRVYTSFDVFGASQPPAGAQVTLSYELRRADGTPVSAGQPQALRPNARGQFSVTMAVTLPQGAAGEHELVLKVRDDAAGKSLEVVEPLTVTR